MRCHGNTTSEGLVDQLANASSDLNQKGSRRIAGASMKDSISAVCTFARGVVTLWEMLASSSDTSGTDSPLPKSWDSIAYCRLVDGGRLLGDGRSDCSVSTLLQYATK